MKRIFIVLALVALVITAVACSSSANSSESTVVNNQQTLYSQRQPVPVFNYSAYRDALIQIYVAKTNAVSTYAVFYSYNGQALWSCPSRGYPIPGGTQLTNPFVAGGYHGDTALAQAEPDGTFSTANSEGTYVLCVRPNGEVAPVYSEPAVMTFPFPVKIVNGQVVPDDNTKSSVDIKLQH